MSYDIELACPVSGQVLELDEPHQMRGGKYAIGGTRELELNITYNYYKHYRRFYPKRSRALEPTSVRIIGSRPKGMRGRRCRNSWQWPRCGLTVCGKATD